VAAYLASVYLIWDARRLSDEEMVAYFRRRAVVVAVIAGLMSIVGIFVLRADARYLFDGLTSRGLPFVVIAAVAGAASLWTLLRASPRGARILAMVAVASVVLAWGVAQWDFILPKSLTISEAAAPSGTILAVLVAVGLAVLLVLPGFVLLYVLDQRGSLPQEGVG
jgi:cytochrome bd ubiquinol oxidase subunit II